MPTIKDPVFNPKVNEYIWDKLVNITDEQKKRLTNTELKLIGNKPALRTFCSGGFLDKKLALLTKMGIEWHLSFFEQKESFNELLSKVYRQFQMKKMRVEFIEEAFRKGVFVVTNKQIALSLNMLGENSTKRFINTNFMRLSNKAAAASSVVKDAAMNPEYIRSEESVRSIARMVSHSILLENFIKTEGLRSVDFLILLVLFYKPNDYFDRETLELALTPDYTDTTVQSRAFKLFQQGYLEKVPTKGKKPIYTITAKGIAVVGRAIGRVTNLTENL